MDFAEWLQRELDKRGWDQSELARRSEMSTAQVSRVVSGGRDAGPEFCIAISRALRIPREDVFRARGWLLTEPESVVPPGTEPRIESIVRDLESLPANAREWAIGAIQMQLHTLSRQVERDALLEEVRRLVPDWVQEAEEKIRQRRARSGATGDTSLPGAEANSPPDT